MKTTTPFTPCEACGDAPAAPASDFCGACNASLTRALAEPDIPVTVSPCGLPGHLAAAGRCLVCAAPSTCARRTFRKPTALRDSRTGRFTTLVRALRESLGFSPEPRP